MEHTLEINNLGPIDSCKLQCSPFMALTGKQASGKSTVAKALYYFRSVKDDIIRLAEQQALYPALALDSAASSKLSGGRLSAAQHDSLLGKVEHHLRDKFLGVFGSSRAMSKEMQLNYYYTDECYIKVSLKDSHRSPELNYVWIEMSTSLRAFLDAEDCALSPQLDFLSSQKRILRQKLAELLGDPYTAIFVPAGRSTFTVLSEQLSYIYGSMEDFQKRTLDYCTREYIERILKLKPEFSNGLTGLVNKNAPVLATDRGLQLALELTDQVLCGKYRTENGEERIMVDESKYVKINYASSGQQESVWILNLLFYYLLQDQHILFIIEEPEAHLFPESQKYITELMALVGNLGHSVIITTHSPYVLGTLNNLLYASALSGLDKEAVDAVIPSALWLDGESFGAWFVRNGKLEPGMVEDANIIESEKLDEISRTVNDEFDRLLGIELKARDQEDARAAE